MDLSALRARIGRSTLEFNPTRALALFVLAGGFAVIVPATAGATVSPRSANVCAKVSAATVSSVVGWTVPAGTVSTFTSPASKTNFEISTTTTSCTYGSETSMASLPKVVILEVETTSKAYTATEFQESLAELAKDGLKIKVTPYSGLGGTAFYFTETEAGITAEGISDVNGTHGFGASVETTKLSQSKLAQLAKLAANI